MDDAVTELSCEWPLPPCESPATARIIYATPKGSHDKPVCSPHFRQVEEMLWARGLAWRAEPLGASRKILALRRRATAEDLSNREFKP